MTTARWGGRALALAAVALATFAVAASAPNQPKKNDGDNEVYFGGHPAEWVCYDAPYELTVHYTAAVNNLEVTIDHPGSGTKTKAAPKGTGTLTFVLDFDGDTTNMDLSAKLHTAGNVNQVKASCSRSQLCFLKGMMVAGLKAPALKDPKAKPPVELPKGVELADMANARKGQKVAKGLHHGEFAPVEKYIHGGQVRFWVQARFKKGPAKMEYDRTAALVQTPRADGKWEPKWFEVVAKDLDVPPAPNGEVPQVVVLVALLDGDGRVLQIRPHW